MHIGILIGVVGWCLLSQVPAASDRSGESVDVRYARAQLQLAEANLTRVQESNKRVARSVPSSVVAEYQYDVDVAKARLEQATGGRAASEFQVWLRRAEAEQKAAATNWRSATAANQRVPGTFGELDIERFRLRAEVATLQLERGRLLTNAGREAQLQWEVELLDDQVQRLKEEAGRATSFIGLYPVWAW
ncbi:MAG: hypothetical protein AB7G28_01745 [Pirellulales bacterium]